MLVKLSWFEWRHSCIKWGKTVCMEQLMTWHIQRNAMWFSMLHVGRSNGLVTSIKEFWLQTVTCREAHEDLDLSCAQKDWWACIVLGVFGRDGPIKQKVENHMTEDWCTGCSRRCGLLHWVANWVVKPLCAPIRKQKDAGDIVKSCIHQSTYRFVQDCAHENDSSARSISFLSSGCCTIIAPSIRRRGKHHSRATAPKRHCSTTFGTSLRGKPVSCIPWL